MSERFPHNIDQDSPEFLREGIKVLKLELTAANKRIADLEQRYERQHELYNNQVRQTRDTYQDVFDRVLETIEHTCGGLPDGCGWGHPIEQIVGMMLSRYKFGAERAAEAEALLGSRDRRIRDMEQALGVAVAAMDWVEASTTEFCDHDHDRLREALANCRDVLEAK